MNDITAWLAGGLMALVLAASMILDGPTETQAAQDAGHGPGGSHLAPSSCRGPRRSSC